MFQPSGCETKRKGNRCEAHVLAALTEADLNVLVPWGDNARYDLVVEIGSRFLRIQCKAGRLENGCVVFSAYMTGRGGRRTRYEPGDIDYYGVWCPATQGTYLVPLEEARSAMPYLRVEEPRPGSTGARQKTGIRWAGRFAAALVIESWLRTGGRFEPAWTSPALANTGRWHPLRVAR